MKKKRNVTEPYLRGRRRRRRNETSPFGFEILVGANALFPYWLMNYEINKVK